MPTKQQLCTFITLFSKFLYHHCTTTIWKCLFHILWRTRTQDNDFFFLFLHFDIVFYNSTPEKTANIWRIERQGISATKFEAAQPDFLNDVFVAVAVVAA